VLLQYPKVVFKCTFTCTTQAFVFGVFSQAS